METYHHCYTSPGVAAEIEHEIVMKQEELEFAKEQLKDEEAEAQLAALR